MQLRKDNQNGEDTVTQEESTLKTYTRKKKPTTETLVKLDPMKVAKSVDLETNNENKFMIDNLEVCCEEMEADTNVEEVQCVPIESKSQQSIAESDSSNVEKYVQLVLNARQHCEKIKQTKMISKSINNNDDNNNVTIQHENNDHLPAIKKIKLDAKEQSGNEAVEKPIESNFEVTKKFKGSDDKALEELLGSKSVGDKIDALYNNINVKTIKTKTLEIALDAKIDMLSRAKRIISIKLTNGLSHGQVQRQVKDFELKQNWDRQQMSRTWYIEKANALYVNFASPDNKQTFIDEFPDRKMIDRVHNIHSQSMIQFIRKPVKLFIKLNATFDSLIVEKNIRSFIGNIIDFKVNQIIGSKNSIKSYNFATNAKGLESIISFNWKLPYLNERNNKVLYMGARINARFQRCKQCSSLMGTKPHGCPGERCLTCNEIGHGKKNCKAVKQAHCINCGNTNHQAKSSSCSAYIRKAYELLMETDISERIISNKSDFEELIKHVSI